MSDIKVCANKSKRSEGKKRWQKVKSKDELQSSVKENNEEASNFKGRKIILN